MRIVFNIVLLLDNFFIGATAGVAYQTQQTVTNDYINGSNTDIDKATQLDIPPGPIYSQLQSGSKYGMNTLEQCLNDLFAEGLITQEEALGKASNLKALKF